MSCKFYHNLSLSLWGEIQDGGKPPHNAKLVLVGGWPTPLKNDGVLNWMEKMFQSTHQCLITPP